MESKIIQCELHTYINCFNLTTLVNDRVTIGDCHEN